MSQLNKKQYRIIAGIIELSTIECIYKEIRGTMRTTSVKASGQWSGGSAERGGGDEGRGQAGARSREQGRGGGESSAKSKVDPGRSKFMAHAHGSWLRFRLI